MAPSWSLLLEVDLVRHLLPLFREFLFKCYLLLIAWGFLVPTPLERLCSVRSLWFGELLGPNTVEKAFVRMRCSSPIIRGVLVLIPFCGVNLFAPMFLGDLTCLHAFLAGMALSCSSLEDFVPCTLLFTLAMGTPSLASIPFLIFAPFEESSSSYPRHVECHRHPG